jgi:N-acetylmuramoyl-L-alanine amidase
VTSLAFQRTRSGIDLEVRARGRLSAGAVRLSSTSPSRARLDLPGVRLAEVSVPAPPRRGVLRRLRVGSLPGEATGFRLTLDLARGAVPELAGITRGGTRRSPTSRLCLRIRSAGEGQEKGACRANHGLIIAIDPGHGGADSGAMAPGGRLMEKDVTLNIAHRMRELLQAAGYRVVMSRWADQRLKPDDRKAWLQTLQADVLVSVHCDSADEGPRCCGSTTYFHAGSERGRGLATAIQEALVSAIGSRDLGVRPDTSRYESGFYLLRMSRQPAVLVETGYISHPETARRFTDPKYCQRIARGIVAGLQNYLGQRSVREARR